MAIQITTGSATVAQHGTIPNRNVAQQPTPQKQRPQQVAQHGSPAQAMPPDAKLIAMNVRIEFLERAVAELRELIARQAVAPAKKSRAEYYREYRKRTKS